MTLPTPAHLPLHELLEEAAPQFKVRPPRVNKLKSFEEGPVVLLHQVDANDTTCAILTSDRVDKDAIEIFRCLVDEIKYFLSHLVILIEKKLPILVKPVEGEIFYTDRGPLVLYLLARTIDDVRYFICCQELKVLRSVLITKEEAVFDFYRTKILSRIRLLHHFGLETLQLHSLHFSNLAISRLRHHFVILK